MFGIQAHTWRKPTLVSFLVSLCWSSLSFSAWLKCTPMGAGCSLLQRMAKTNLPDFLLWHSYLVISSAHILRISWDFYSIVNVPSTLLSPRLSTLLRHNLFSDTFSPQLSKSSCCYSAPQGPWPFLLPMKKHNLAEPCPELHTTQVYHMLLSQRTSIVVIYMATLPGPTTVGNSQFLPQHPPSPVLPGFATNLHQGTASLTSERPTNLH